MRDNMDEIPSGGIGIKIIGKIADELSYTHNYDNRNCLKVVKLFEPVLPQNNHRDGGINWASDVLNKWLKGRQSDLSYSQPLQKITLELNSDLATVTEVLCWVEQLESLPIPESVLQLCKLAAVEGFTNAVRHAHQNLPLETPIELEITVFNERLEMKIWDWGKPFDLQAKLKEELTENSPFSWEELGFTL